VNPRFGSPESAKRAGVPGVRRDAAGPRVGSVIGAICVRANAPAFSSAAASAGVRAEGGAKCRSFISASVVSMK
jgi:hypothetical protein